MTCQLDYLCGFSSDFERRRALGQLPPTLHETYLRLLQKFSTMPPSTQAKIEMCLHFTAFSPIRLTIGQLRTAISTPETLGSRLDDDNLVSEDDIEFMCGSLLRKTGNDVFFEFAHFSVREFLEHESLAVIPSLQRYQISRERSNEMLASQSLRFLQLSNFDVELPNPEWLGNSIQLGLDAHGQSGIGFHLTAARLSIELSRENQLDSTSASLMKSLFHPRKSSCFLMLAAYLCFDLINHCSSHGLVQISRKQQHSELANEFQSDEFQPIHLAAAFNLSEVCHYLVDTGSDLKHNSSLGAPFELSVMSFLRLVLKDCDPTLIEKHHHHLYHPIRTLLGRSHQRNATFRIFEHTRLEEMSLDSVRFPGHTPMVTHALIIAFAQNDFWILQRLLDRGMSLEDTIYTRLLPDLMFLSSPDIRNNEQPVLLFLQDISSRLESESGWSLEIGRLIWRTAVELDLTFTKDPTVTDSRISLSKDALVSRAFATISNDDMEGLQKCLADGRLDLSERHRDPLELQDEDDPLHLTLLHFAVYENKLQATTHLLQAGCDPNTSALQIHHRILPIHDCSSIDVFELLLVHGASMTDIEVHTGENIWHMYGLISETKTNTKTKTKFFHPTEFFESVARRLPAETAEALLTKSKNGHTPLQHLLVSGSSSTPRSDHVERVMALVEICQGIVDFWSRHEPIFGAAAAFGSDRVIRRLIEVGARFDTIDHGLETPLHRINIESSSALVESLKEIFPEAVHMRFKDQLPLQAYLERCLHGQHPIDDSVVQQLWTAESLQSIDGRGTSLWEYYCNFNATNPGTFNQRANAMLWAWLLGNNSAMQVYEKESGKNGLILILSRLTALDETQGLASVISPHVLNDAMDATDCWETIKSDSNVLRFLRFAIEKRADSLVSKLIGRGVNVHDQVDGYSALQIAFQSPLVVSLSSDEEGRAILQEMIDHSTIDHLNCYDRDGLTILHSLATNDSDGSQELEWLIRTLVGRGVDVNRVGAFRNGYTPMAHHLDKGSVVCATYLLNAGADPGLAKERHPDAAQVACWRGLTSVLRNLLDRSKQTGMLIEWGRKVSFFLRFKDGFEIDIPDANALHYASLAGRVEVLEFYVSNGLIDDLEIASAQGWTAMHFAAMKGHVHLIKYLGSKGCRTMPEADDKTTPLHLSVREQHHEATKALIQLGAKDIPDATGVTPNMYASRSNDKSILQLLDEFLPPETSSAQDFARDPLPRKRLKPLSTALEKAIKSDNLEECKRLYAIGCPINISIQGLSPLILALGKGHVDIAEWLLDKGATTTSRLCRAGGAKDKRCLNAIAVCLLDPKLCKLLPKLIDQCIQDGSGWPFLDDDSLLSAIECQNTEGLSMLLKLLDENATTIR